MYRLGDLEEFMREAPDLISTICWRQYASCMADPAVLDLAKNPGNFRNKAGHGGIEAIQYDASVVRYVIRNVASTIVLLSEIMKKEC